jgi:two-component system invasion response regulator UvrY
VLVLDINLPGRSGLDVLHALKDEGSPVKVLVVSCTPKTSTPSAPARRRLRLRQQGRRPADAGAGRAHRGPGPQVRHARDRADAGGKPDHAHTEHPHQKLSDRELQTLVMIASGKRLSDIAEELMLSPKTVSVYRARVLEKLAWPTTPSSRSTPSATGWWGSSARAGPGEDAVLDDPLAIRQAWAPDPPRRPCCRWR